MGTIEILVVSRNTPYERDDNFFNGVCNARGRNDLPNEKFTKLYLITMEAFCCVSLMKRFSLTFYTLGLFLLTTRISIVPLKHDYSMNTGS